MLPVILSPGFLNDYYVGDCPGLKYCRNYIFLWYLQYMAWE